MVPFHNPDEYLFNLYATSSSEAKRLWIKHIKEKWNYQCAYCNSEESLTIDHIIPQSKGGLNTSDNIICCCRSCNKSKKHYNWEEWYFQQTFYSEEKKQQILDWLKPKESKNLYTYKKRKNISY